MILIVRSDGYHRGELLALVEVEKCFLIFCLTAFQSHVGIQYFEFLRTPCKDIVKFPHFGGGEEREGMLIFS